MIQFTTQYVDLFFDSPFHENCPQFQTFWAKFSSPARTQAIWRSLFGDVLEQLEMGNVNIEELLSHFTDFHTQTGIMKGLEQIEGFNRKKMFILKRFACFLHSAKNYKPFQISKLLQLSQNQVNKSIQQFKKGDFQEVFRDKRGEHKKAHKIMSIDKLDWLNTYLVSQDYSHKVENVRIEFNNNFPEHTASNSTIRRAMKNILGFKFAPVPVNCAEKNCQLN